MDIWMEQFSALVISDFRQGWGSSAVVVAAGPPAGILRMGLRSCCEEGYPGNFHGDFPIADPRSD